MTEKTTSNLAQQILEALALQLESNPGQRITTAALAKEVGVSEAALYRHFPSKARMFEALIEFIEESIFSRVNRILEDHATGHDRCQQLLAMLLGFSAKTPRCQLFSSSCFDLHFY